jgi:hypothetical protein
MAQMAQRFGKSPALDYLGIRDPVLALVIDDALHQRLVAFERSGKDVDRPPAGQRFSTDADYDDADWTPPAVSS